jgi:DNA topoisomerase IB
MQRTFAWSTGKEDSHVIGRSFSSYCKDEEEERNGRTQSRHVTDAASIPTVRMTKIMEKETDGHTAHNKSLTLTTLRMTNIMVEEMDGHKARIGSLKLLHRRIKQTSPQ